jgi:transaldolase
MATVKLAEGIRKFAADLSKLEKEIQKRIDSPQ